MYKFLDSSGLQYFWGKIKSLVPNLSKKTQSIPFGQVDSTSTSTAFTATIDGIDELRDGVCCYLRNGVVTSASGFTININNLGAKPAYNTMATETALTTQFNKTYTMLFIYNSTRVSGGCWDMYYGYDSNTTYNLTTNYTSIGRINVGEYPLSIYSLCAFDVNDKLTPFVTTATNDTGKTLVPSVFPVGAKVYVSDYSLEANSTQNNLGAILTTVTNSDLRYSSVNHNIAIFPNNTFSRIFMPVIVDVSNNTFTLTTQTTNGYNNNFTNERSLISGKFYIDIGFNSNSNGSYYFTLIQDNRLYYYNGTKLIDYYVYKSDLVLSDLSSKADKVSNSVSGNFAGLDSNGNLTNSGHKHGDYVTSLGTSGNIVTWTKNGTTNNLTVPYATKAEKDYNGNVITSRYIPYGAVLQSTNPFGGKGVYINSIDNAFHAANRKYWVRITTHLKEVNGVTYPYIDSSKNITDDGYFVDSPVVSTLNNSSLFNGNYEDGPQCPFNHYIKVHIQFAPFTNDWTPSGTTAYWGGYPYGTYYLSYYYTGVPSQASQARIYNKYSGHTVGWNLKTATAFTGTLGNANYIEQIVDEYDYQRSCVEFIIFGLDSGSKTTLTEIDYKLSRPNLSSNGSTVTKYGDQSLYYDFEWFKHNDDSLPEKTVSISSSNGFITANKFIKSGGTSSQFLKADGSVDSSTYLTSANLPTYTVEKISTPTSGYRTSYRLDKNSEAIVGSDTIDIPNEFTPLISKEYLDNTFYSSNASFDNSSRYFMSVRPDALKEFWYVKYRVRVWIPADTTDKRFTDSIIEYFGSGISMKCYRIWNTINTSSAAYYQVAYWLTDDGYNNQSLSNELGHIIGTSILYGSSYTTSSWYRHVKVDLLAYEGCEVNVFDNLVKWSAYKQSSGATNLATGIEHPDYGTTDPSTYNATSQGLQETGDTTDTTNMYLSYARFTAGTYGMMNRSLVMQDGEGKWQSFTTTSGTATGKTKNPSGFILGSKIYYMSSTTDIAANDKLSTSLIRAFASLIDFRYDINVTTTSGGANNLVPYKPLYIVGTIGDGTTVNGVTKEEGLFYLDDVWWTQDEPSTENGKIYIKVCPNIYNDYTNDRCYRGDLDYNGDAYWYKNGIFQRYYHEAKSITENDIDTIML